MVLTTPVIIPFAYWGHFEMGEKAWFCISMTIIAIRARWSARRHRWFWWAVLVAAGLQIPILVYGLWRYQGFPVWSYLPLSMADFFLVYGCIKISERLFGRVNGAMPL